MHKLEQARVNALKVNEKPKRKNHGKKSMQIIYANMVIT